MRHLHRHRSTRLLHEHPRPPAIFLQAGEIPVCLGDSADAVAAIAAHGVVDHAGTQGFGAADALVAEEAGADGLGGGWAEIDGGAGEGA